MTYIMIHTKFSKCYVSIPENRIGSVHSFFYEETEASND